MGAAHGVVLLANAHVSRRTVLHMLPPSQMGAVHGVAQTAALAVGRHPHRGTALPDQGGEEIVVCLHIPP